MRRVHICELTIIIHWSSRDSRITAVFNNDRRTQLYTYSYFLQGIINQTGTETFAKELKLAKLLLVMYNKKVQWFLSHVCIGKFAVFRVLCCRITCKWTFFLLTQMYIFIGLHRSLENIIDSLPRAQSRLRSKLNVYEFQLAKTSLLAGFFVSHRHFMFACAATNRSVKRLE